MWSHVLTDLQINVFPSCWRKQRAYRRRAASVHFPHLHLMHISQWTSYRYKDFDARAILTTTDLTSCNPEMGSTSPPSRLLWSLHYSAVWVLLEKVSIVAEGQEDSKYHHFTSLPPDSFISETKHAPQSPNTWRPSHTLCILLSFLFRRPPPESRCNAYYPISNEQKDS